ncbi:thiamine pyrophosphate-binding protein [Streptomyces nitrosporeus]|uniref:Thiamine pyrophosphate-binding protein n=1 Tax=Streptomyces nitrosporeus TaxID=28894 RepID=A0A5J6FD93_9ACTN|nr:thiamine pyrophosphate-binding protein [Streptomyces nitrosporeus]QEU74378.1 thiamine pyrophosphate-binding protein [Streptomyces nitrosporeus]GGY96025.1 acetolactate synthase [Streptomyces nitrosporeus]
MSHDHDDRPRLTAAQAEAALNPPPGRLGGDLVVETLQGLGATTVFGVPGAPVPGTADALDRSPLTYAGLATESGAGFAADAYGRITGEVATLLLTAGPGALAALPALQEAAAASAPVLAVCAQVPAAGLGGGRHGYRRELRDQQASFRDVVKSVHTVRTASQIPSAIAAAWESALTAPHGPVWVEIPEDVLSAGTALPPVSALDATPRELYPRPELTLVAADLLTRAERPAVIAGGGVVRADASGKLRALAERISAPVATTYGGKGAFPWTHPLSLRSWPAGPHTTELLESADVLLVVGTGLGELTTEGRTFAPRGRIVHIEADAGKLEANHPALGIHSDAREALDDLLDTVDRREDPTAAERVRAALDQHRGPGQEPGPEQRTLDAVRAALPAASPGFWDLTPLTTWAWAVFDARRPNTMHSAQGAGGPGYALPAAIGAAFADRGTPVLAVSGRDDALRSAAELSTAARQGLPVTWLITDDGGHEPPPEEQGAGPAAPDLVALAAAFGVPALRTAPESLTADLTGALRAPGPSVLVLPGRIRSRTPGRD